MRALFEFRPHFHSHIVCCLDIYTLSLNTIHHPTREIPSHPVYHADTAINLPSELRPVR